VTECPHAGADDEVDQARTWGVLEGLLANERIRIAAVIGLDSDVGSF
jgi:hypothetical protein